jgi:hypothetical protein
MHKLVILIEPLEDWTALEDAWPEFLRKVESMPGLLREASSRVDRLLSGSAYAQIHELYFDSLSSVINAMSSPDGRAAGRLLQSMTSGKMTLLIADHHEDEMENIRKYRQAEAPDSTQEEDGSQ